MPEEPIEDQKSQGDTEVAKIKIVNQGPTRSEEEDFSNSLFTFNFLNEDKPSLPAAKGKPQVPASSVPTKQAETKGSEQIPAISFMGGQPDEGLNSNFHNFFTNDRIFGSPSPN